MFQTDAAPTRWMTIPTAWAVAAMTWFGAGSALAADAQTGDNHAPRLENKESFELPPVEPRPGASQGSNVSDLLGNAVNDPDKNAERGMAVTHADNSHGRWQYSLDNGDTWIEFSQVSDSNATLLPATPSTRIRFEPEKGYEGKAEIQFRAWDQTSGKSGDGMDTSKNGGQTAFSSTQEKVNIDIKPLQQFDKDELAALLVSMRDPAKDDVDRVLLELMRRGISVNEAGQLLDTARKKSPCAS